MPKAVLVKLNMKYCYPVVVTILLLNLHLCTAGYTDQNASTEVFPGSGAPLDREDLHHTGDIYSPLESILLGRELPLYRIGYAMETYYTPIICVVGLVGNFLSAAVMFQPDNRGVSCHFYMGFLAISDSVVLWCSVVILLIKDYINFPLSLVAHQRYCSIIWGLTSCAAMIGTFIIQTMTLDRLVAVMWPLKAITWCTMQRTRRTCVSILLFCIAFKLPYIWISVPIHPRASPCLPRKDEHLR